MTAKLTQKQQLLRYDIVGAKRFSNYWWATVISIGATGFFLASLSSYLHVNLLPISSPVDLIFIPQGIAMGFYGVAGLALAAYLWLSILWDVGGGYNEFDKTGGQVHIFRWGYPGKNRRVEVSCRLNPKRSLYLRIKGRWDIPLTRVGQPLPLSEIETQAAEIAQFLGVPMEGL
jgi:hypothetical protein